MINIDSRKSDIHGRGFNVLCNKLVLTTFSTSRLNINIPWRDSKIPKFIHSKKSKKTKTIPKILIGLERHHQERILTESLEERGNKDKKVS